MNATCVNSLILPTNLLTSFTHRYTHTHTQMYTQRNLNVLGQLFVVPHNILTGVHVQMMCTSSLFRFHHVLLHKNI